jgi:hypothetical protein
MLAHHDLTERVIGLAIAVHKELGPGHSVPSADRDFRLRIAAFVCIV